MAALISGAFFIAMKAKIRDAQPGDLCALVDLLDVLFSMESDFTVDAERQRMGLSLMLEDCGKRCCIKVAERDGQPVGMCTAQILISTAEGGPVALIEDMVVLPGYRRQGIGRQLMLSIEGWALERDITRLQLLADRANFTALDFYDKAGWRPTQLICLRRKLNH